MTATQDLRVLIYGFPPFGAYSANISEQAIAFLHVPMSLDPAHAVREIAPVFRSTRPLWGSLRATPASAIVRP